MLASRKSLNLVTKSHWQLQVFPAKKTAAKALLSVFRFHTGKEVKRLESSRKT